MGLTEITANHTMPYLLNTSIQIKYTIWQKGIDCMNTVSITRLQQLFLLY
jgi:hypothetical protein